MITIDNYFSQIPLDIISSLPETLLKGHEFVNKVTHQGSTWNPYHSSEAIKKTIDLYLSKLNDFLNSNSTPKNNSESKTKKPTPKTGKKEKKKPDPVNNQPAMVERIPEELRFIRRFINLNGKTKTKEEIL